MLHPRDTNDIQEIVLEKLAKNSALLIQGNQSQIDFARLDQQNSDIISMCDLNQVKLYEPGALYIVAQAGASLSEIEKTLDAHNQMLAFEPMNISQSLSHDSEPTIGGIVATNLSGSRRVLMGGCRDHVLGVEFINGAGEFITSGGRVMKNVTGLDLAKLQCGAYGSLGILTQIVLKTMPKPEVEITIKFENRSIEKAIEIFTFVMGNSFEISGAVYWNNDVYLRLSGFEIQIQNRLERIKNKMNNFSITIIENELHQDIWQSANTLSYLNGLDGDLWQIAIKPSAVAILSSEIKSHFNANISLDLAGGRLFALIHQGEDNNAHDIKALSEKYQATARLLRSNNAQNLKQYRFAKPENESLKKINQSIKKQFDPMNIFNSPF